MKTIENQEIDELKNGVYQLINCKVYSMENCYVTFSTNTYFKEITNCKIDTLDNCRIDDVYDSTIKECEFSEIKCAQSVNIGQLTRSEILELKEYSEIKYVKYCTIEEMCDYSHIHIITGDENPYDHKNIILNMRQHASIDRVCDTAFIKNMHNRSVIKSLEDKSMVETMWGKSSIDVAKDDTLIRSMTTISMVRSLADNATIVLMEMSAHVDLAKDNSTVCRIINDSYNNAYVKETKGNAFFRIIMDE